MSTRNEDIANEVERDLAGEVRFEAPADPPTLHQQIQDLLNVMKVQQEQINNMQRTNNSRQTGGSRNNTIKAPPVPAYSGKKDEKSSVKVKGFIYNVRKVGALSNMDEAQLLTLAECHLQDNAASWMMRLEESDAKPTTLDQLQTMMVKEFVPSDERSRARMKLLTLQMKKNAESHISHFQDLVQMCNMPLSETYLFFFMSLTGKFKEEFTKKFPTGEPDNMQEVYDFARTIDRSIQWSKSADKGDNPGSSGRNSGFGGKKDVPRTKPNGGRKPNKDDGALSWGPAKKGERNIYRSNDRCFFCGVKGYSTNSCDCKKGSKDDPKSSGSEDPKE